MSNDNSILNNQGDVLTKAHNFLILGHIKNGLLNDTLKYFRKGKLRLIQVWENGSLKSNLINKKEKIKKSFDLDLLKFYDSIKVLPDTIFKEKESTVFRILNIPSYLVGISIAGGSLSIENENFVITPSIKSGELIIVQLRYNDQFNSEFKKYTIKK